MLHAMSLAAVPLAALFDRSRWLRGAAVVLLALHMVTPQTWPMIPTGRQELWGLSRLMTSSPQGWILIPLTPQEWQAVLAERSQTKLARAVERLVALVLALGAAWLWGRTARRPTAARWAAALVASVVLAITPIAALARRTPAIRLTAPDGSSFAAGWAYFDRLTRPGGARVAYAGTNMPYYLMGSDLRNDVRYENIDAHRHWLLHDYHRTAADRGDPVLWPDPRPGWDRLHPDYEAWLANLRADQIQYLVVTRANPADGLFNLADREGYPIERVWADVHPESFTLVYGPAQGDPNVCIYRVHPVRPDGMTERTDTGHSANPR